MSHRCFWSSPPQLGSKKQPDYNLNDPNRRVCVRVRACVRARACVCVRQMVCVDCRETAEASTSD